MSGNITGGGVALEGVVEGPWEGGRVSKGLGDQVRTLNASTEEGMTHGLVGGNIRAA